MKELQLSPIPSFQSSVASCLGAEEEEPDDEEEPEYMNDFITNTMFRQFLLDNNCYKTFLENCYKHPMIEHPYYKKEFDHIDPFEYINVAFMWFHTDDPDYWDRLNTQWRRYWAINKDILGL